MQIQWTEYRPTTPLAPSEELYKAAKSDPVGFRSAAFHQLHGQISPPLKTHTLQLAVGLLLAIAAGSWFWNTFASGSGGLGRFAFVFALAGAGLAISGFLSLIHLLDYRSISLNRWNRVISLAQESSTYREFLNRARGAGLIL